VMKLVQPCWQDQAANGPSPLGWSIGAQSKIAPSTELVAVARGNIDLEAAVSRQLAVRLLKPPPVPPFGSVLPPPSVGATRVGGGERRQAAEDRGRALLRRQGGPHPAPARGRRGGPSHPRPVRGLHPPDRVRAGLRRAGVAPAGRRR